MINLNKDLNTGQMLMKVYVPMEMKKKTTREKEWTVQWVQM